MFVACLSVNEEFDSATYTHSYVGNFIVLVFAHSLGVRLNNPNPPAVVAPDPELVVFSDAAAPHHEPQTTGGDKGKDENTIPLDTAHHPFVRLLRGPTERPDAFHQPAAIHYRICTGLMRRELFATTSGKSRRRKTTVSHVCKFQDQTAGVGTTEEEEEDMHSNSLISWSSHF